MDEGRIKRGEKHSGIPNQQFSNPWLSSSGGGMLGWISMVAASEAGAASAPQTAHSHANTHIHTYHKHKPQSIVGEKKS